MGTFHFNILTTREGYDHKPSHDDMRRLTGSLEARELTVAGLARLIERGHSFRNRRKLDGTEPASVIMVDIDDLDPGTDLTAFMDSLTIAPTLAYTTPSDLKGEPPTRRVRLLYVTDEPITDAGRFESAYWSIADANGIDTSDNCGAKINQIFHGNGTGNMTWLCEDGDILHLSALSLPDGHRHDGAKKTPQAPNVGLAGLSGRFAELLCTDWTRLLAEYAHLAAPMRSPGTLHESGLCYLHDEGSYITIIDRWERDSATGRMRPHRWKDGERRRKKVYMAACVYLAVTPDLTLEALVYNIVMWMRQRVDNTADTIAPWEIVGIAERAMHYRTEPLTTRKRFTVNNGAGAFMSPMSAQKKVGMCRRAITDSLISRHYDAHKSIRQNHRDMKDAGLSVSRDAIIRYVRALSDNNSDDAAQRDVAANDKIMVNVNFWKEGTGGWPDSDNISQPTQHIVRVRPLDKKTDSDEQNALNDSGLTPQKVPSCDNGKVGSCSKKVPSCKGKKFLPARRKNESLDEFITRWYDPEKTPNANLRWAKGHGIKIGENTLYKYAHEHGCTVQHKKRDKRDNYKEDMRKQEKPQTRDESLGERLFREVLVDRTVDAMTLSREEMRALSEQMNRTEASEQATPKPYPDTEPFGTVISEPTIIEVERISRNGEPDTVTIRTCY